MKDFMCPGHGCNSMFSLNGRDPKILQCLHTFCVQCLKIERGTDGRPFVLCPALGCGKRHYLETGANLESELKTDYLLKRASSRFHALTRADARCDKCSETDNHAEVLCETCTKLLCHECTRDHQRSNDTRTHVVKEVQKVLQEALSLVDSAADPVAPFSTKKQWKCEGRDCKEQDVKFYCLTCNKMICHDCAITSDHARRMAITILNDPSNYPEFQIQNLLTDLKKIRDDFAAAIDATNTQIEELDKAWRLGSDTVKTTTVNLQVQLSAERDALMKKVETIHDVRVREIDDELESLSKSRENISHSVEYVRNTLMCLPEDILDQEKDMLEGLEQCCREFNKVREPSQRTVFVLTMDPVNLDDVIGHVYTNPDPSSLVNGIDQVPFIQGKKTVFQLACCDQIGTPLPSTNFEVAIEVSPDVDVLPVRNNGNGTYTVTLTPQNSGEHVICLDVQLEYQKVALDPVTVIVSPALLPEAQVMKTMQIPQMVCPAGITVVGQNIVIADREAHKLFVVSEEGECLNVIGREGEREGEFSSPQGVDCGGKDLVVVADTGNNRVQILSIHGGFINAFGKFGGCDKEFMMPTDVAVSVSQDTTMVYVADTENLRIQYFTIDGDLIGIFTSQNKPFALCVDDQNRIFVAEAIGNQFQILSQKYNKNELQHLNHSNRSTPEPRPKNLPELETVCTCTRKKSPDEGLVEIQSIAYDSKSQYVMVTERDSPYISVFSRDGTYVGAVLCPGEGVQLANIAIFNSCVLLYDSGKCVFFILRLF